MADRDVDHATGLDVELARLPAEHGVEHRIADHQRGIMDVEAAQIAKRAGDDGIGIDHRRTDRHGHAHGQGAAQDVGGGNDQRRQEIGDDRCIEAGDDIAADDEFLAGARAAIVDVDGVVEIDTLQRRHHGGRGAAGAGNIEAGCALDGLRRGTDRTGQRQDSAQQAGLHIAHHLSPFSLKAMRPGFIIHRRGGWGHRDNPRPGWGTLASQKTL